MLERAYQTKIHKRVKDLVAKVHEFKNDKKKLEESDITKHIETIQLLMNDGLWPAPGGAWCSAGVPVYDGMSDCGGYPMFRHFDYKGDDVTPLANLDCQTPYYFVNLENGKFNEEVIDLFIDSMKQLQKDYNFDGFRVDHIDHIVDEVSQNKKGQPLSYRIPAKVLNKVNSNLKKKIPYFATLAEYMLWDGYFKEYHKDMKFDLLWGDDIVAQSIKTPEQIINDNLIDVSNDEDFEQSLATIKKFIKKIKTRDIKNRVIRGDDQAIKEFTASKKDENNL